jgi:peptidoglycan/LPS O-acetylase OafA/YrhL
MQTRREQIHSLTGLRGVAAGWVMLMHFREVTPTRVWEFPVLDKAIANGAYGVDIFFVLSGFILCHVYAESFSAGLTAGETGRFLANRFARIYPVHLVTFAAMLGLFAAKLFTSGSSGLPDRYDPVTLLTTLTLTNAWLPGVQTPNMPAWSVSAEWFAYLLFPVLCSLLWRKRWALGVYLAAGLGLAFFKPLGSYCLTHVLSGFLVGMTAYRILPFTHRMTTCRFAGLSLIAAIVIWAQQTDPPVAIGLLLFSALILALVDPSDLLSRFLSWPVMLYLGEISYSLYMVHWLVRIIIRYGLQVLGILDTLVPSLIVSLYVLVTLIAAMASYRYVELPGRTLLRRAAARWEGRIRPIAPVAPVAPSE